MEAASGPDERLRDAVAREQEFRDPEILEVDRELAAQAEERTPPMLRSTPFGPTPMESEEHRRTHELIELGVVLASLAEVAETHMR